MIRDLDAIILGAGPAGAEAALTASARGLAVALVDEQPAAGGQICARTRAASPARATPRPGRRRVARPRRGASRVATFFSHRVWSVVREGDAFRVDALGPEGPLALRAPALVVATGAHERVVPFPAGRCPASSASRRPR